MGLNPNNTAAKRQKGRVRQSDRQTEGGQVAWISHSLQGFVCELWSERVAAECLQKKKKAAAINAWISYITAEATHRTKGQENTWGESHGHADTHTHTLHTCTKSNTRICTHTHSHLHEKWLTAVSIITQAAEHGGHSTICSQYVSAAPLPPQRDTEDNLKGGGGGGGCTPVAGVSLKKAVWC